MQSFLSYFLSYHDKNVKIYDFFKDINSISGAVGMASVTMGVSHLYLEHSPKKMTRTKAYYKLKTVKYNMTQ